MERLWILIDADDTLWENNIYFEQAFDRFVDLLDHSHLTAPEVRQILDEIELDNIRKHGYGSLSFGRNLVECFGRLVQRPHTEAELEQVRRLAHEIMDKPIELLHGVEDTLGELRQRHHLTLYSKGHPEEQHAKLRRSGLQDHFHETHIVPEKTPAGYREAVAVLEAHPGRTWMVGNSPKSDINPALEAGLGAVLVPHPWTWSLEHEQVPETHERLHVVGQFSDLRRVFLE